MYERYRLLALMVKQPCAMQSGTVFPTAVHLRCLKHVKDSIEHKLHELQFDRIGMQEIMHIFGQRTDQMREIGLADAIDSDDFFAKLMSLEKNGTTSKSCIVVTLEMKSVTVYFMTGFA